METLTMSARERGRLGVMTQVKKQGLRLVEAARLMRVSYRQAKRIWRRYRQDGDRGLIHGNRGRASNRKKPEEERRRIVDRYQERYQGFGPTLAAEHLAADDRLVVDHETLRRWLLAEGAWQPRKTRARHRSWRERKACQGEMVQMDGSEHDWFEGRAERAVLMVMIDDATNRTLARFYPAETTAAAFDVFGRYARRYGLPGSLYVDQDSIYKNERQARIDEELREEGAVTQFKRAMRTLGVEVILAYSPQAKGRVERRNQVFQDRLVKEMRLRKIASLEEGNRYLAEDFLPAMNRRFVVRPRAKQDVHRAVPKGVRLAEVLCWEEPRVVQNDWTLRWCNQWFQVDKRHAGWALPRKTVVVRRLLDGQIQLLWKNRPLRYCVLPKRPAVQAAPAPNRWHRSTAHPPALHHPWKKLFKEQRKRSRSAASATPSPHSCSQPKGTFLSSPNRGHF